MDKETRIRKIFLTALKISVGSCAAMYIAELLNLQFAVSAGSITLLTLLTTKWETLRLSLVRLLSFAATVLLSYLFFEHIPGDWIAYGVFLFVMTAALEGFGWRAALSVNAVICTHFLTTDDFSAAFILNEFLLVLLGISIAVLLNLFNNNAAQKRLIEARVTTVEAGLTGILGELALYLRSDTDEADVWGDIKRLENDIDEYIDMAHEYQDNTFSAQPGYYIDYFEMRARQIGVLHNLHNEIDRMRGLPRQAEIVADYIMYLKNFVTEMNDPAPQIERLNVIFEDMREEELPETREEFENRALLYHILMDLEEFLKYKRRFVISARHGRLKNTRSYTERYFTEKIRSLKKNKNR